MAVSNMSVLSLSLLVLSMVVSANNDLPPEAEKFAPQLENLVNECLDSVVVRSTTGPPQDDCCDVVKAMDVPCMCSLVTPDLEKLIDIEKVTSVLAQCGRPTPPGTVCQANSDLSLEAKKCVPQLENFVNGCLRSLVVKTSEVLPPQGNCCDVVKSTDIACVCSLVNPDVEKLINVEKLASVLDQCGCPMPGGTKCGSYTSPEVGVDLRTQMMMHG